MIRLLQYDFVRLDALRGDATQVDGLPVVDGALPPTFVIDEAIVALRAGGEAPWCAPFAFVERERGRIVGSGIFKGEPDEGWVEIGYGVAAGCRGAGHATDAVFEMVRLAFAQPGVRAVYAETSTVNGASRRVVEKVGFMHAGQRFSDDDGMVDCWFVEKS
ncbi:MAG: GNAT family N-acetyltransferase [Burkholderiaceae bacterium]